MAFGDSEKKSQPVQMDSLGQMKAPVNSSKNGDTSVNKQPAFATMDEDGTSGGIYKSHEPTDAMLKHVGEKKVVDAPHDRFYKIDTKEIFKTRSAWLIIFIWLVNFLAMRSKVGVHPQKWFLLSLNPDHMLGPWGWHISMIPLRSFLAFVVDSVIAPLTPRNWNDLIVSSVFLLLICFCGKFVKVDDVRILKSYLLTAFVSSLLVWGIYSLIVFGIATVSPTPFTQALQNATYGISGLWIGLVGLWTFLLMQVMFERSAISSYTNKEQERRRQRSLVVVVLLILGVLYLLFNARLGFVHKVPQLHTMCILIVILSMLIGVIRGVISYSTILLRRHRGRL